MSTQYRRISMPPRPSPVFPKSRHTSQWLLACVRNCVVRDHWKNKKQQKRLKTTSTTNGELFSSNFDLIIYFCVVEFVQIWGAVKAHCQIASSLPFFFFLSTPSSQYKRTFNTRTTPASPPVQDISMYLMMLMMVVVVTTTARSFLAFFYFILILFLSFFFYIKDSLVQSSLEQRGKRKEKKKAGKTSQSTRSLSKPQAEEVTSFNSFSRCVWSSSFVNAEKETTHTETHTHTDRRRGRSKAGARQLVVPNWTLFFLSLTMTHCRFIFLF